LVKLRELKVEDCDSLQEIIMGKEDVDIAFVSLEILILKGLPSLNNFCSSKCCLKFPLLEKVVVSNCPLMEIFSEGNTSTPSLRKVRIEENSEEWTWKRNLNDTIKEMFEDKVCIDLSVDFLINNIYIIPSVHLLYHLCYLTCFICFTSFETRGVKMDELDGFGLNC
jgi:hypothetical protein